jgi:excisionase family DNA binding protein
VADSGPSARKTRQSIKITVYLICIRFTHNSAHSGYLANRLNKPLEARKFFSEGGRLFAAMNNITTEQLEGKFGALVSKRQVARYLGVCIATIENWVRERGFPQMKLGGLTRFDKSKSTIG